MSDTAIEVHRIIVCTTCRWPKNGERVGAHLLNKIEAAVTESGLAEAHNLDVVGVECMAGCSRSCTIGYQAEGKASYLFGDINPNEAVDALVDFAEQYATTPDGWTRSTDRPAGLRGKTLSRIPGLRKITAEIAEAAE